MYSDYSDGLPDAMVYSCEILPLIREIRSLVWRGEISAALSRLHRLQKSLEREQAQYEAFCEEQAEKAAKERLLELGLVHY